MFPFQGKLASCFTGSMRTDILWLLLAVKDCPNKKFILLAKIIGVEVLILLGC